MRSKHLRHFGLSDGQRDAHTAVFRITGASAAISEAKSQLASASYTGSDAHLVDKSDVGLVRAILSISKA